MAEQRHLDKAPITEALIDFRVKLRSGFNIVEFSSLEETLRDTYPSMRKMYRFEGEFKVEGSKVGTTREDTRLHGYSFRSDDGKNVVQFREDGFTFNRLYPYTNWKDVSAEAERLWGVYLAKAPVELVTRIAVRYINQLNIPLPITDFAKYLTAPPSIPTTLPQEVSHFLTRMVVHDRESGAIANITQALQKSDLPGYATIVLDIDVYRLQESGFDVEEIQPILEQLHHLKNRIFFDSITDETARLFE